MRRSIGLLLCLGFLLVPVLSAAVWAQPPATLPAAPSGFDARRDGIAQGKVETVEYDSKSVGAKRNMVIYTPPGYSKESKYPVLYLLHGAGDDETGWTKKGSAAAILDNLYAAKKIAPMIVVMPNGFARRQPPQAAPCRANGPGAARPQRQRRLRGRSAQGRYSLCRVPLPGASRPRAPRRGRTLDGWRAGWASA